MNLDYSHLMARVQQQGSATANLKAYLVTLRRRKWTVVISAALFLVGGLLYDQLKTPIYEATAQVELLPQVSPAVLQANSSGSLNPSSLVDVPTDSQVIESQSVANQVKAKLPNAPGVSVSEVGTTNIVNVSVKSRSPRLAQEAANLYAKVYIQAQQYQQVSALTNATQIVQKHISDIQTQVNQLQQQYSSASSSQQASISAQVTSLQTSQNALRQQIAEYQTAASLATGGGQIISKATLPTSPVTPKKVEYAVVALILGLFAGASLALLREYLDERIHDTDGLQEVIGDLPILGALPRTPEWRDKGTPYVATQSAPKSFSAEAYRSLRTSVEFLRLDRDLRLLQVTSPNAADGKSTTVANLAIAAADSGVRTLVLDCDLRRPRVHRFFNVNGTVGFTSVLLGSAGIEEVVQRVPWEGNLEVIPAGVVPPNPSELLAGGRTASILRQIADRADLVLIDSPPVLPVTDASVLAPRCDGVMLVTSIGIATRKGVGRALEKLRQVDAPLIGVVVNQVRGDDLYASYGYEYGFHEDVRGFDPGDAEMAVADQNGNGAPTPAARRGAHRAARRT